jgi:NADPH:quinone reductase-like Zn-dependent oxidoreductase
MKAFTVTRYGKDGLAAATVAEPALGAHDVLIAVAAASVNPLDLMIRNGEFKRLITYRRPFVLGHDLSGVVTAVGSAVERFAVGDEVYSRPRDGRIGTFAERIAVDEADVALKPASLSFVDASAVPLVALAAWQLLVERAAVGPGSRVLVHAGAGGLGSTVIQLARHLGAHVAATASTGKVQLVRSLGAETVVDYTKDDVSQLLSGYDLVIDSLGGETLEKSLAVLKPGGLALGVSGPPDAGFAAQLGAPAPLGVVMNWLSRRVRRKARSLGVRYAFFFMRADGGQLTQLAELYDSGVLRPVVDRVFPFDETLEAIRYVEQGRTAAGKVVIELPQPGVLPPADLQSYRER